MNDIQLRPIHAATVIVLLIVVGASGFWIGNSRSTGVSLDQAERKVAYWRAPMAPSEIYDAPGQSRMGMELVPVYEDELEGVLSLPGDDDQDAREVLYWRAPMDPTEIYDAPGKSRMGMDLIPEYAQDKPQNTGNVILIDPAVVQNMGIRTSLVLREDLSRMIRTVGEVKYDEEKLYLVNSKIGGWIEKLYVNFVGQEVVKGEPLMEIYSPELVSTQEEFLLAKKNLDMLGKSASADVIADATRLLEASRTRLSYWDVPETEINRLEATQEISKTILIEAPMSGVVVELNTIEGASIRSGTDLFRIADLSTVWVHASFYDNEVPWINVGQAVTMELSYLPGKIYTGKVSYIFPFLREKARDVHVRLIFENTGNYDLKPGMYANIKLKGKTIKNAITVPSEAIIRSGQRSLVFVAMGGGKFEPREITTGEIGGDSSNRVRVLEGLLEGEEIVVSAQFMIDSESRLQEAIQKMLSGKALGGESGTLGK